METRQNNAISKDSKRSDARTVYAFFGVVMVSRGQESWCFEMEQKRTIRRDEVPSEANVPMDTRVTSCEVFRAIDALSGWTF